MSDDRQKLQEELSWLEIRMKNLDEQLDMICEYERKGAILSFPYGFADEELNLRRKQCCEKMDVIIEKMNDIRKTINKL